MDVCIGRWRFQERACPPVACRPRGQVATREGEARKRCAFPRRPSPPSGPAEAGAAAGRPPDDHRDAAAALLSAEGRPPPQGRSQIARRACFVARPDGLPNRSNRWPSSMSPFLPFVALMAQRVSRSSKRARSRSRAGPTWSADRALSTARHSPLVQDCLARTPSTRPRMRTRQCFGEPVCLGSERGSACSFARVFRMCPVTAILADSISMPLLH